MTPQQGESLNSLIDDFDRDRSPKGERASGEGTARDYKRLALGAVSLLTTVAALVFLASRFSGGAPDPGGTSRKRTVMDAQTGEVFKKFRIPAEENAPWKNPDTGTMTLYPPERCFWTADGSAKAEPTYVILNQVLAKPGPTICPDCGREVVPHNPPPPSDILLEALEAERDSGRR